MKRIMIVALSMAALVCLCATDALTLGQPPSIVINHTCTDLASIPTDWVQAAKDSCKWHYVRLSHGYQLMTGFVLIEEADPYYAAIWPKTGGSLPEEPNTLCIYTAAYTAYSYWLGSGIDVTRSVLTSTPDLNISAFSWCTELNTASESYVNDYLAAMQTLESEFPDVIFVYFTGTAQDSGAYGHNRFLRNKQIRNFCVANNKVLYDFEALDSHWFNPETQEWEEATYEYNGIQVLVEHPNLAGNDDSHTSYESCEQKGKAAWWMMAVLAGWTPTADIGDGGSDDGIPPGASHGDFDLSCYPNPFNPTTTITFSLPSAGDTRLAIYDTKGALVRTLINGSLSGGSHKVQWNGMNDSGAPAASGVYFYRVTADEQSSTKKILLLR